MEYRTVKACFFGGRYFHEGEKASFGGNVNVPAHFEPLEKPVKKDKEKTGASQSGDKDKEPKE